MLYCILLQSIFRTLIYSNTEIKKNKKKLVNVKKNILNYLEQQVP